MESNEVVIEKQEEKSSQKRDECGGVDGRKDEGKRKKRDLRGN